MSRVEVTVSVGQPKPPSGLRLVATLSLAGLISGIALATAFQVTKPVIDANRARRLRGGVFQVVPGAAAMQMLAVEDGRLVPLDDQGGAEPAIVAGYGEDGQFLAYALIGAGPGFQDTIRLLYGYEPRRRQVIGLQILESRETPGLGDKIYKDADFLETFRALSIDPAIVLVKDGRGADNEVDAISGATISCRAVVKIINQANAQWLPRLPEPGTERPLERPDDVAGAAEGGR